MAHMWQIVKAEIVKQHRNTFHSRLMYFSLLVWPIVIFLNAYYNVKPFDLSQSASVELSTVESTVTFLITGFLGYNCFWTLVESAWLMSFERRNGTLEMVFLSSGNRMAIIYGRSLGALFENIWMFVIFTIFVILFVNGIPLANLVYLPLVFLVLLLSAMVWGGLMNVIFLFSRDASVFFNLFDEPMVLFAGVRIPTAVFPAWARVVSVIFPLTHTLVIVRSLLIHGDFMQSLASFCVVIAVNGVLVAVTSILLGLAERHIRRTGNFTFF